MLSSKALMGFFIFYFFLFCLKQKKIKNEYTPIQISDITQTEGCNRITKLFTSCGQKVNQHKVRESKYCGSYSKLSTLPFHMGNYATNCPLA